MLYGPFSLSDADLVVTLISPGVYILSHDGKTATYVGRSDVDLGTRIKTSANEAYYSHFWFEYASSARDAYLKECEYYHQFSPPHNTIHPDVPDGAYWRCPVKDCLWSWE